MLSALMPEGFPPKKIGSCLAPCWRPPGNSATVPFVPTTKVPKRFPSASHVRRELPAVVRQRSREIAATVCVHRYVSTTTACIENVCDINGAVRTYRNVLGLFLPIAEHLERRSSAALELQNIVRTPIRHVERGLGVREDPLRYSSGCL